MGRPAGPPSTRKEIWIEDRQIEQLEALRAVSPLGKPPFASMVRQALEDFITHQLSNSDTRQEVEGYLKKRHGVVNLQKVANRK
jgi:hypothetical protein